MAWSRFFRRANWDRERAGEIESYIQIETDDNLARGMSPGEARAAARRKFGNPTLIREEIYHMNSVAFLSMLGQDARFSLRLLLRNPAFTAAALLTLAIGIGANTAVFTVLNSVLIRPLAYPNPEQLVAVWHKAPGAEGLASVSGDLRLSPSMFFTYAEQNRTLQALGVWTTGSATITGLSEPEQVRTVFISEGGLPALAVPPLLGRWPSTAEHRPGGHSAVLLSYGYWQRRFGSDPAIVGRTITVNASPREVIGVMPRTFRVVNVDADLIMPLVFDRSKAILPGFGFEGIARLKPGVSYAQANSDIARLIPVWMNSWPAAPGVDPRVYEKWRLAPSLRPLKEDVIGNVGTVLWVLMGTIAIVMLIAAANVANLLLVRAEARQQELAVRAALGAGWSQIVRVMLVESLLLGLIGGALGLGLAVVGVQFLIRLAPGNLPRLAEISIDTPALLFASAVSLLAGLLFGLIPALKYAGPRISLALRAGGRNQSQSRERRQARNVLVVTQIALALVLLISAGLMLRTFQALYRVEPGFTNPAQIQLLRTSIPGSLVREPGRVARLQNDIVDRLASLPGVTSVAFTSEMPMESVNRNWDAVCFENEDLRAAEIPPLRIFKAISPGVFQTTGTRLIAGRDLTWTDLHDRRLVVLISENLAREKWPDSPSAAIGKRLSTCLPGTPVREIVGIVQDVRDNGVQQPAPAIVYWPALTASHYLPKEIEVSRNVTFAIRSANAGEEGFVRQVHQAVWSVNASLPLASVRTMQDLYDRSLSRTSFALVMLAIAAAMALALGIIGIYGVIAYGVAQRRREIGIRLALGAQQSELRRMFVRHGLILAAIGVTIGLGAAAALMRLMKSLLFGISPLDPLTYAAVPILLVLAAVLASYLPARGAASVDPVDALKSD